MFKTVIIKKDCTLNNAETLVNTASFYKANTELIHDNKRINCKSIMGVLSLAYKDGDNMIVHSEGIDENDAIQAVIKCLE
jgi:catabolite repression HPr-like protein